MSLSAALRHFGDFGSQSSFVLKDFTKHFNDGLIRVGERLRNSDLTLQEKHPLIIPQKYHIAYQVSPPEDHPSLDSVDFLSVSNNAHSCGYIDL
jgi:hypothetical protein